MTDIKRTAYQTPWGNERVYANEHQTRRNIENYGDPIPGELFYSLARPGTRKELRHVRRGETTYFAYNQPGDRETGGESLHHLLFKEALLEVRHTRLDLRNIGRFPIKIKNAEVEKRVQLPDGTNYYVDVYLEFESEHPYAEKWSGELYLEVHHTHAVPGAKRHDLAAMGIPVIEVDLKELFLYRHSESDTSRAREEARKAMTKKILESENGFISAKVLSNPSSMPYLKRELAEQTNARIQAEQILNQRQVDVERLQQQNASLKQTNQRLEGNLKASQGALGISEGKLRQLSGQHATLTANNNDLRSSHRTLWWGFGALAAAVIVGATCAFFAPTPNHAIDVPSTPTQVQPLQPPSQAPAEIRPVSHRKKPHTK